MLLLSKFPPFLSPFSSLYLSTSVLLVSSLLASGTPFYAFSSLCSHLIHLQLPLPPSLPTPLHPFSFSQASITLVAALI